MHMNTAPSCASLRVHTTVLFPSVNMSQILRKGAISTHLSCWYNAWYANQLKHIIWNMIVHSRCVLCAPLQAHFYVFVWDEWVCPVTKELDTAQRIGFPPHLPSCQAQTDLNWRSEVVNRWWKQWLPGWAKFMNSMLLQMTDPATVRGQGRSSIQCFMTKVPFVLHILSFLRWAWWGLKFVVIVEGSREERWRGGREVDVGRPGGG